MYSKFFKRMIDFVLSLCGLIILSPVFLVIYVAVKIDSKGPAFLFKKELEYIKNILIFINSELCT